LDGCLEINMEYLIQPTKESSAYDVAWRIRAHHHVVGNKLCNPCNESFPNEEAKFTLMPVHKKVTQRDPNHVDQPMIEPMHKQ
jgi:hypothetical protein